VLAEASVRKRSTARSTYTTTTSGQGAVRFTSTACRIHLCSHADLVRSAGHYTSRVSRHSSILRRILHHPSPFSSEKNPRNVLPSAAQDTQLVFAVSTDFSFVNASPVLTFGSIKQNLQWKRSIRKRQAECCFDFALRPVHRGQIFARYSESRSLSLTP